MPASRSRAAPARSRPAAGRAAPTEARRDARQTLDDVSGYMSQRHGGRGLDEVRLRWMHELMQRMRD
jgi:hypothetical protein